MLVDERVARSVALEQAYVHDVYEQFCDNHVGKPWPKVQNFIEDLEPGSLVCDVGCGNGKYFNINNSIFNMGGDKCMRMCELAREKENEVLALDNLALPFRDESLDAVLSIAVVHHLATTERRVCALRELARVLRIGGRLIISVWAMEQANRKFESQDVLVPWHRPQRLSTPSLELSTTTTSEDDGLPPYHAYTQSDSDSGRSSRNVKRRSKSRHKGRSIDPCRNSSPSSSSLSSPNETCYSFVRRALQKLAGGSKRVGVHRPWFLDSWTSCAKEPPIKRYEPEGCECSECDNVQDMPIELRRIDDEEAPQRRQTFPSSTIITDLYSNLKSRSLSNIKTAENNNNINNNNNSKSKVERVAKTVEKSQCENNTQTPSLSKPRLVKQKKSVCDEDADEALDKATDMEISVQNLTDLKIRHSDHRGSVFKQRSLNEELMSSARLREKEKVRQNIQKQTSLNDEWIFRRQHTFDSFKSSIFSASTSNKFQLIKTGFANKFKNSTTNIEVTSASLKNGFVRIFQNWKNSDITMPIVQEDDAAIKKLVTLEEKKECVVVEGERRHSKEDGSDSSKDSSLQSDTSVDSEDSFASVIFVPKSETMSPTNLSPGPTSPMMKTSSNPNSPRIKQSSCPTSPRIKQMPLTVFPLTKQLSSPKPSSSSDSQSLLQDDNKNNRDHLCKESTIENRKKLASSLAQKYAVPQIPKFKKTNVNSKCSPTENVETPDNRTERLKKIKELLTQKPGFGTRSSRSHFPIVRHSSVNNGKLETIAKPLPKLLSLELFNPETDDKDSDSSAVSSPDSVDSVISVEGTEKKFESKRFTFPNKSERIDKSTRLLEAAADVANSLDNAVQKVIKSSPRAKRRQPKAAEIKAVMERQYPTDTTPLLKNGSPSWDDECHKHLTNFADKLSAKLLQEIDQYQESKKKQSGLCEVDIDDPYIHRLSEELQDLSILSAEIQKQNEYLAKLSVSDSLFGAQCERCGFSKCVCKRKRRENDVKAKRDYKKVQHGDLGGKSVELNGELLQSDRTELERASKLSASKNSIKMGASTDSCDSERGSSRNSMVSSVCTSLNSHSIESGDSDSHRDGSSSTSRCSDGGSTASLASCPEWKTIKNNKSGDNKTVYCKSKREKSGLIPSLSDTSQESLPSDNIGGEITYHRYYHVFREGELDQLIEKYVENLHIISSYYDHSSWCVIAEKVQVWTI